MNDEFHYSILTLLSSKKLSFEKERGGERCVLFFDFLKKNKKTKHISLQTVFLYLKYFELNKVKLFIIHHLSFI
jgi:hypothetical protein